MVAARTVKDALRAMIVRTCGSVKPSIRDVWLRRRPPRLESQQPLGKVLEGDQEEDDTFIG